MSFLLLFGFEAISRIRNHKFLRKWLRLVPKPSRVPVLRILQVQRELDSILLKPIIALIQLELLLTKI